MSSPSPDADASGANYERLSYSERSGWLSWRSKEELRLHLKIEKAILRAEWKIIALGLVWQYVHSVATNFVYWLERNLDDCQRKPLYDLGYELFPRLRGRSAAASEVLVDTMFFIVALEFLAVIFIKLKPPHGRTLYLTTILRRVMACLFVLQTLRITSFLITLLPGAASQCRPNSGDWNPPKTVVDVLFRIDATTGCGDLMFSSHTIFTMTIVMVTLKYFSYPPLAIFAVAMQTAIAPLIIAARKHYSLDVFTALYVVPMWWTLFDFLSPDPTSLEKYGVEFTDTTVIIHGEEFPLPIDGDDDNERKSLPLVAED
jgi:hypothetical protein